MILIVISLFTLLLSTTSQRVPLGLHGSPEYVDLLKNSPRWQSISGSPLSLDPQGWPTEDFSWIFDYRRNKPWEGPDFNGTPNNIYGTYRLKFSGQSSLTTDNPTTIKFTNQTYNPSTHTTTVSIIIAPNTWVFSINFKNTQRPGKAVGTGLVDVSMVLPGYSLDSHGLFTDRFLEVMSMLKPATFRSFDTGINGFNIWNGKELVVNKWEDRSLPTDAYWPLPSRNNGAVSGLAMPWEIYMQICLQTNTPGWFNLPVGADDDYVTNFAKLLKNGNNYTKPISPNNPFYIEYSNEVWNWGFSQSIYNEVVAKQEGVTTIQRYVERAFQISQIFRQVFGDSAMGTTVRFVCLWQYSTWQDMQEALLWAQTKFGKPVDYYIYGIGEAPYVDPTENGNVPYPELDPAAVDRLIDTMYTAAGVRRQSFAAWKSIAQFFGIHEVGYESGPSLVAGVESDVNRSPRMKDFENRYYMENYFATGADTVNFFALGPSAPGSYGDWFMFEHWGEYDYGKFQGFLAVAQQQKPPVSIGFVLPWNINEEVTIDASQYSTFQQPGSGVNICAKGCWPTPAIVNYLLRSSSKGTYQVTLYGSSQSGASVQVWLNNQVLKTVSLPVNGGQVSFSVDIETPLNTLALSGSGTGGTSLKSQGVGISIKLLSGGGTPTLPSAPLNVIAKTHSKGVMLNWENVTTATHYTIQRSTQSSGPYTTINTSTHPNYTDSGLTNDVIYYYVVYATNSAGNSALSPQIEAVPIDLVVPAKPQVQTSTGLENGNSFSPLGQAFLQWEKIPNTKIYEIHSGTSMLNTQTATSYFISGLNPGASYTFMVIAKNDVGSSNTSVTVQIPSSSIPGDPINLSVDTTGNDVHLKWLQPKWSYPELGELFSVERSTETNGNWVQIATPSVNNLVDYGVATNHYCYRVWATNGKSGKSVNPTKVVCAK